MFTRLQKIIWRFLFFFFFWRSKRRTFLLFLKLKSIWLLSVVALLLFDIRCFSAFFCPFTPSAKKKSKKKWGAFLLLKYIFVEKPMLQYCNRETVKLLFYLGGSFLAFFSSPPLPPPSFCCLLFRLKNLKRRRNCWCHKKYKLLDDDDQWKIMMIQMVEWKSVGVRMMLKTKKSFFFLFFCHSIRWAPRLLHPSFFQYRMRCK